MPLEKLLCTLLPASAVKFAMPPMQCDLSQIYVRSNVELSRFRPPCSLHVSISRASGMCSPSGKNTADPFHAIAVKLTRPNIPG